MSQSGIATPLIPVVWAMLHVVKMVTSFASGSLTQRFGLRPIILSGWLLYAFAYFAFSQVRDPDLLIAVILVYGIFYGLTEAPEKTLVSLLVSDTQAGTAFGGYNMTIGFAVLPASLLFGLIAARINLATAFLVGAVLALVAAIAFYVAMDREIFRRIQNISKSP